MPKHLTDEEVEFLQTYDYPIWLTLEEFEKRFGHTITGPTVRKYRGASERATDPAHLQVGGLDDLSDYVLEQGRRRREALHA